MAKVEEKLPLIDPEKGKLLQALQDDGVKKGHVRRRVQEAFGERVNPKFAEHAEHAFRGACALVFFAIPLVIPDGLFAPRDYLMKVGVYGSGVCMFIIFNLGTSFGEAFDRVKSGLQGNLMAAIMGWSMYGLFPEGVQSEMPGSDFVFWGGVGVGCAFVGSLLILRFNVSTQMFALSSFACTWMNFLDENQKSGIIPPWRHGWSLENDVLTQSFACTGMGMIAVMIASLLPYPRWSLDFAMENQLHANTQMVRVLQTMMKYYAEDTPNRYIKDQVIRRLGKMKGLTFCNRNLLAHAWWECYGFGSPQMKRRVLAAMDSTTQSIFDITWNAWRESISEEAGERDATLIRKAKPKIDELLMSMEVTMNLLVKAASDGALYPAETLALKKSFEDIQAKDKELAAHFHEARHEVTQGNALVVYQEIRVAHVLLYSMSHVVGKVVDLADQVHQSMNWSNVLPPPPELGGFKSLFENLTDKTHLVYALRGLLAFYLAFTLGWFGFRDVIPVRTSAIASTTPFLITMYVGSAMVSDLNRVQGLMLGYVMARILSRLTATCGWADLALHLGITWVWIFAGVFVREHSKTFSSIGSMAAAFGGTTLLAHNCADSAIDKEQIFNSLAMNCIAVLITTLVNLVIPTDRASDLASKALFDCWDVVRESLQDLYDPKVETVTIRSAEAQALLQQARDMGAEAGFEPRLWRMPWQSDLFDSVVEETGHMVATVSALETALRDSEGKKKESLRQLTERSSLFNNADGVTVVRKLDIGRRLLGIFQHETAERFPGLAEHEVVHTFSDEEQKAEQEFLEKEMDKIFGGKSDTSAHSMRQDEMAAMATVLANLSRMKGLVRSVQHKVLQYHWEE